MIAVRETGAGVVFQVRVVPRASRAEIVGSQDGALKLRIMAPPVEGRANEECIRMLAGALGVKKAQVVILAGSGSRTKTIAVTGIRADAVTGLVHEP
jgi:uncharacterized protein (TIGR00251 family)